MGRVKGEFRIKTEERIKFLLENGFENLQDDDKFSKLFLKMVTSEEELNNLKDWFLNKETKLKEKDVSPIITRLKPIVWNERLEKEAWGEKFDRSKFKGKLTFQERILNMIFDGKI
ncbi:hypothetical protein [Fusobacterium sp.]|uniref:hypothetical protein n=1 Tax=Fusobacterium sp. TaxID=68766 RepID=UPI002615EF1A|nr:hypothetical protein [Fusobacterium sp.]